LSGFFQFEGNFVRGQNNSKYRDRAPVSKENQDRDGVGVSGLNKHKCSPFSFNPNISNTSTFVKNTPLCIAQSFVFDILLRSLRNLRSLRRGPRKVSDSHYPIKIPREHSRAQRQRISDISLQSFRIFCTNLQIR